MTKRLMVKNSTGMKPTALQLAEEYKGIRGDNSKKAKKQREVFSKLWKEYRDAS